MNSLFWTREIPAFERYSLGHQLIIPLCAILLVGGMTEKTASLSR